MLAAFWCCALIGFALATSYPLALALLFTAGFFELAFNAMAQTLVQLNAPADMRGRVLGPVQHGEPRVARVLRDHRRPRRQPGRRALVARVGGCGDVRDRVRVAGVGAEVMGGGRDA